MINSRGILLSCVSYKGCVEYIVYEMIIMDGGTAKNLEEKHSCDLFQCTPLHSPGKTEENQEKYRTQP